MTEKLPKDDGKKGFGGFGDLVSDVSKDIEFAKRESSNSSEQHTIAKTEPPRVNRKSVSLQLLGGSSVAKWFWGIGIVMVVWIVVGSSGKKENSSYSPPTIYSSTSKSELSDSEIVEQLAEQSNFDLAGARKAGYTDQQIIKHLSISQPKDGEDTKHGYAEFNGGLDKPAPPKLDPLAFAPNGQPWPTKSGYLRGYKKLNSGGLSSLTIDNSNNDANVYLKLFSLDGSRPSATRHVFIKAGDKFTFSSVRAGNYDVRYRDLRNGGISKSEGFELREILEDGGTRYSKMTLTLYKIQNGNMQMRDISEAEF